MSGCPVGEAVETLRGSLRGPRRAREELVREVADGLHDAVDAYLDAGLNDSDARRRALSDFGDPRLVARQLQVELTAAYGRRTAVRMALAFPGLMLLWDAVWLVGPAATARLVPQVSWLATLVDVLSVGSALGCVLAAIGLGRDARRGVPVDRVTRTVGVLGLCTLVGTGTGSLLLNLLGNATAGQVYGTPLAWAVLVTTCCVACWLVVSVRRCLALGRVSHHPAAGSLAGSVA
ncbi:hypothetical protein SacmaDRAFT_3024 [Saccharomonospora marina XMU15]|uniref:Uncharacterized protein n=1 Tax=Saccharomonospora marina XMU15 TaxID=882083 RepID=H5X6N9_9PSEU|nr:permease prefix domain 1-containing protein [Saccharomonospora marina]EHR51260.1 hypothetical protein SacmaDRAFT_3024 [Saccharomonospora marina XMU15]